MTDKRCRKCGVPKPVGDFYPHPKNSDGRHSWCIVCCRAYNKRPRRVEWLGEKRRRYYLSRYGITLEEYDRILASQGGVCAICGGDDPGTGRPADSLVVDHDHANGRVRGILCHPCNRGIGYLKDRADLAERACSYLRTHG